MTEKNRKMMKKAKLEGMRDGGKRQYVCMGLFVFFNFFLIFFELEDNCFIMLYWFLCGFERVTGRKAKGLQKAGK